MIYVDIYVPSLDMVMDFQLDEAVPIYQLINEISEILCKRTKESLNDKASNFILGALKSERILPVQLTLGECGITNGSELILV